jgi:hypothetical protein
LGNKAAASSKNRGSFMAVLLTVHRAKRFLPGP